MEMKKSVDDFLRKLQNFGESLEKFLVEENSRRISEGISGAISEVTHLRFCKLVSLEISKGSSRKIFEESSG